MIGWIYSVAPLATGVTRGCQKKVEGAKTIAGTSNRFRVLTEVAYDDFMQLERPLGVTRVPSRLAAPPRASPSSQTARLEPSHQVPKCFGKSPSRKICSKSRSGSPERVVRLADVLTRSRCLMTGRGAARRESTRATPRGLSNCTYKIIIRNVSNDLEAIRSAHDRFGTL